MSGNRCGRCGRQGSDSLYLPNGPPGATPPSEAPEGAWAPFDGEILCPRCQTPDQRRLVAMRIPAAIEREVERRQEQGIVPDEYEVALTEFAMDQRARLDGAAGPASAARDTSGPARDPGAGGASEPERRATGGQPAGSVPPLPGTVAAPRDDAVRGRLQVAVTGAFLTGRPLAVSIDRYADLQARLGTRLTGLAWRTDTAPAQGGTYATEGGGGFTRHVPLVIAQWEGVDYLPWLSAALEQSGHGGSDPADGDQPALRATPKRLVIDVYDLGVAVLAAWFDLPESAGADLDVTARALKRLVSLRTDGGGPSPVADVLQRIVRTATTEYGDAVAAVASDELLAGRWRSGSTADSGEPGSDLLQEEYGRLLWLHPVHVLTEDPEIAGSGASSRVSVPAHVDVDGRRRRVRALAPAFHDTITLDGGVFAPGIGASAVVAERASDAEHVPLRLIQLHWAYYALHIAIDRNLLGVLDSPRWSGRYPLKELEVDADNVFADHQRIMTARGRLDSQLSALGGDELAVWDTIAKVQRFDAVREAVDHKLEMLEKLAERRVSLATTERTRRIGNVVGALTALTVVSLTGALVGLLLGAGNPQWDPWWVSVGFIVIAFAGAAYLFLRTFVKETRDQGSRSRRRRR